MISRMHLLLLVPPTVLLISAVWLIRLLYMPVSTGEGWRWLANYDTPDYYDHHGSPGSDCFVHDTDGRYGGGWGASAEAKTEKP